MIDNPGLYYIPIYLKGMGKAMPRGDNLIIPYNAALCIGTPQLPKSTKVKDLLIEIQTAIDQLKIN